MSFGLFAGQNFKTALNEARGSFISCAVTNHDRQYHLNRREVTFIVVGLFVKVVFHGSQAVIKRSG